MIAAISGERTPHFKGVNVLSAFQREARASVLGDNMVEHSLLKVEDLSVLAGAFLTMWQHVRRGANSKISAVMGVNRFGVLIEDAFTQSERILAERPVAPACFAGTSAGWWTRFALT